MYMYMYNVFNIHIYTYIHTHAAQENPRAIIGGGFVKIPEDATQHYAK
jgi:hypothetical protein